MIFKGDAFVNRYRLEGELIAITPTHVGTGETLPRERQDSQKAAKKSKEPKRPETHEVAVIARDFHDRPYLPGSALRGNVRHYLLQVFRAFGHRIAAERDFDSAAFRDFEESQQIDYMINHASLLEQLFGTPFSEGKVEFWDAPAFNKINAPEYKGRGWDQ